MIVWNGFNPTQLPDVNEFIAIKDKSDHLFYYGFMNDKGELELNKSAPTLTVEKAKSEWLMWTYLNDLMRETVVKMQKKYLERSLMEVKNLLTYYEGCEPMHTEIDKLFTQKRKAFRKLEEIK